MRVVHVIDSGGYYGAESMLLNLCLQQKKQNLDVEVISIGVPGEREKPLEERLSKVGVLCQKWRMKSLPDVRQALKMIKQCEKNTTDIIHCHGYKGNILFGLVPKFLKTIPIISTVHGYTTHNFLDRMTIYQFLDKLALRQMDAVVLVSESIRYQIHRKLMNRNVYVVPNGIPENVDSLRSQENSNFETSEFTISAIGRLSREKNFSLIIESFPKILEAIPHARLFVYGEGPERATLEKKVTELNLGKTVFLPGYAERPEKIYEETDIFVNCSTTEGMPVTILEAMRAGCQIVATNIPANRVLLEDLGPLAALVDATPAALTNAVIHIKRKDSDQLKKERKALQNVFRENYTLEQCAEKYLSIYRSL